MGADRAFLCRKLPTLTKITTKKSHHAAKEEEDQVRACYRFEQVRAW
jgi:hypothetical protein